MIPVQFRAGVPNHINAETKEINVPHDISETKRTRLFTISDNLHAWLEHCRSSQTALIPINLKNKRRAFVKTLTFPWIQDGLRHTFCTLHCAKHRNIEGLRHIMGNSPTVIDRFYKGAIGKGEVEKFWKIMPRTDEPEPQETHPSQTTLTALPTPIERRDPFKVDEPGFSLLDGA